MRARHLRALWLILMTSACISQSAQHVARLDISMTRIRSSTFQVLTMGDINGLSNSESAEYYKICVERALRDSAMGESIESRNKRCIGTCTDTSHTPRLAALPCRHTICLQKTNQDD